MTDPRLFEIAVTWQPADEYDPAHGAVELTARHFWDDDCRWHDRPDASEYHQPWTYMAGIFGRTAASIHQMQRTDPDIFHRTRDDRVALCCTIVAGDLTDPLRDVGAGPSVSIAVHPKRRSAALRAVSEMLETIRTADARTFSPVELLALREVAG